MKKEYGPKRAIKITKFFFRITDQSSSGGSVISKQLRNSINDIIMLEPKQNYVSPSAEIMEQQFRMNFLQQSPNTEYLDEIIPGWGWEWEEN